MSPGNFYKPNLQQTLTGMPMTFDSQCSRQTAMFFSCRAQAESFVSNLQLFNDVSANASPKCCGFPLISCHIFLFRRLKSNYFSLATWVSVKIFCYNSQWIMVSSPPQIVAYVHCSLHLPQQEVTTPHLCGFLFLLQKPTFSLAYWRFTFLPCQVLSVFLHHFLFSLILLHGCSWLENNQVTCIWNPLKYFI